MDQLLCSFCGKHEHSVTTLISGQKGHICDQCIHEAWDVLHDEDTRDQDGQAKAVVKRSALDFRTIKPQDLKARLDAYVIGQEEAKKRICVAAYRHYKRLAYLDQGGDREGVELEKSNLLIVGPPGSGKTLMLRTLAKMLDVPFCIIDATTLTQHGYVGQDPDSSLFYLYQQAGGDVKLAQRGIVYIDEMDKLGRKGDNPSITRDVSGEGVQQSLLKLIEGTIAYIPPEGGRKHPEQKMVAIDTSNILFICGGSFEGIREIIERRIARRPLGFRTQGSIGQGITDQDLMSYVTAQDFKAYGFIPELVGRLPNIVYFEPLTSEALRQILTEPKNALIKQYTLDFAMDDITLTVGEDAIDYIVDQAVGLKLGARGLRSLCDAIMKEAMFILPSTTGVTELHVDRAYAVKQYEAASRGALAKAS